MGALAIHEACGSFGRISNVALCAEKSIASGDGLKFARIGERFAVTVHPKDSVGEECTKQVYVTTELTHCTTQTSDAPCTVEMESKSLSIQFHTYHHDSVNIPGAYPGFKEGGC